MVTAQNVVSQRHTEDGSDVGTCGKPAACGLNAQISSIENRQANSNDKSTQRPKQTSPLTDNPRKCRHIAMYPHHRAPNNDQQ